MMEKKNKQRITVLGVGNILFTDEGFGVRVIEALLEHYVFPEDVSVVDGGVLGLRLLGVISESDRLIVVDAIRNGGKPGDLHRLNGEDIPARIRAKNSLHQVDFLETLAAARAMDRVPEVVILGVEPKDMETFGIELTPTVQRKIEPVMMRVLGELDCLGVSYRKRRSSVCV